MQITLLRFVLPCIGMLSSEDEELSDSSVFLIPGSVTEMVRKIEQNIGTYVESADASLSASDEYSSSEERDVVRSPRFSGAPKTSSTHGSLLQEIQDSLSYDGDCSSRSSLTSISLSYSDTDDSDLDSDSSDTDPSEKEDLFDMWKVMPDWTMKVLSRDFIDIKEIARLDSVCSREGRIRIAQALKGFKSNTALNFVHTSADSVRYAMKKELQLPLINIIMPVPENWTGERGTSQSECSRMR